MTEAHQNSEPPIDHVADLGATFTALASSSDDLDCLEVFANAQNVGTDEMGPLLFNVLVEPLAEAQILMIGRVRPGMTILVDADLQIRAIQLWCQENERDD
ncbi:MAG TPA: hypothetical protein VIL87_05755 [Dermatophilaceae bacterium]|jgi:hypothetical protein